MLHTIAYISTLFFGAIAVLCLINAVALHNNWTEPRVNRAKIVSALPFVAGVVWVLSR